MALCLIENYLEQRGAAMISLDPLLARANLKGMMILYMHIRCKSKEGSPDSARRGSMQASILHLASHDVQKTILHCEPYIILLHDMTWDSLRQLHSNTLCINPATKVLAPL